MNLNRNWFIYLVLIALIILIVLDFKKQETYRNKIELIDKKNDSLNKVNTLILKEKDSINSLLQKEYSRHKALKDSIKRYKKKRNEIPNIVSDYDERKLDSILANHKHTRVR